MKGDSGYSMALFRCDWLIVVAVVFLLLTTAAMLFYPGSTNYTNRTTHYSFSQNFFSDLGATRVYNERLNVVSNVLFMIALALVGTGIMLFGLNASLFTEEAEPTATGKAALVASLVSGAGFIAVAAVPWNVSLKAHEIAVQVAFGFLLVFVVLITIMQFKSAWPLIYKVSNLAYICLLAAYMVLLFFGPRIETLSGLETQAIGQKIIVYSSIINIAVQAYGLRRSIHLVVNSHQG